MGSANLTGLLLAAGIGARFGGNKLSADLGGRPLALHAAHTLAPHAATLVAVCNPANDALNQQLAAMGYRIVINTTPEDGLSRSLALGTARAGGDGLLVCLADMPFVTHAHLNALLSAFSETAHATAVATLCGAVRTPPAVFPTRVWPQLLALDGDQGARALLQSAIPVRADAAVLRDIDTPADLAKVQPEFRAR